MLKGEGETTCVPVNYIDVPQTKLSLEEKYRKF